MTMKHWIIGLSMAGLTAFAAVGTLQQLEKTEWTGYEAAWKTVDSLDQLQLPESALKVVEDIYAHAKAEKNGPQTIKSTSYKAKYTSALNENGEALAIQIFENEIKNAVAPEKNILQSQLAEMYWSYFTINQWRISARTYTDTLVSDDINTWDKLTLYNKALSLYQESIRDREVLKKIKSKNYAEILIPGNAYGELFRPTLFDLLGHRALEFYLTGNYYLPSSVNDFTWSDPNLFASPKQFSGYAFDVAGKSGVKFDAVRLLQDLTTAHLYDPYPDALVDVTLTRYAYAKANGIVDNQDSVYLNALLRDEKQFINDSSSARISHLIGLWHREKAGSYVRLDDGPNKWENKTALEYLDKAIAKYPNSMGGLLCTALKNEIISPMIQLNMERVNVADLPFRMSVQYKNTDTVWCTVYPTNAETTYYLESLSYDERIAEIDKLEPIRSWEQTLPGSEDYNLHIAEIKADGLPFGNYLMVIRNGKDTSSAKLMSYTDFWISNMSFIAVGGYNDDEFGKQFYVTDRTTGKPLKGVKVQTFKKDYSSIKNRYENKPLQTYVTDANGLFIVRDPLIRDYYDFSFLLTNGKDQLEADNNYYIAKAEKSKYYAYKSTYFFTDRKIYRPGQTIYFKGIVVEKSEGGRNEVVVPGYSTIVYFYDANYQRIGEQVFTTNEYGSFSGSFTAPVGTLTGQMQIRNELGSVSFSVEEYKRPTFAVEVNPLEGDYAVNDSVQVTGKATAYSGAVIDQATVQYRVTRSVSYPYPFYTFGRKMMPAYANDVEIAFGEVKTDGAGAFIIPFKAIPDPGSDKAGLPIFTYTVSVDVTDLSGETRSSNGSVSIGYHSLSVSADVAESYVNAKNEWITIKTSNLNGSPLSASGTVSIHALSAPNKLYRERLWDVPDQFTMSEKEFHALFPHDQYRQENNQELWTAGPELYEVKWDTKVADSIQLPLTKLKPGVYRIEIQSIDKQGNHIKQTHDVSVVSQSSEVAIPDYLFVDKQYLTVKPGSNAVFAVGSSADNVQALVTIYRRTGTETKWVTLKQAADKKGGSMTDFEIPVTEADRGGMHIQISHVKDGRWHSESIYIFVPYNNKELKLSVETHRDKLQPGAQETWKINITGDGGEAVAAELLASMYDKSLDAFKGYYKWDAISWPQNYLSSTMTGGGFESRYAELLAEPGFYAEDLQRYTEYYELLSCAFTYGGYINIRGSRSDDYTYLIDGVQVSSEGVLEEVAVSNLIGKQQSGFMVMSPRDDFDNKKYKANEYLISTDSLSVSTPNAPIDLEQVQVRTNFNETAFFYPQLQTDSNGSLIFSFTMPEALTTWKFIAFAHTKDMRSGTLVDQVITQKELMIQPNMPRFLREGDRMSISAKISNLSEKAMNGVAKLEFFNATNMQPLNSAFGLNKTEVNFAAAEKGSTSVEWEISVPEGIDAVVYRIKASDGTFTDGEENGLPVLSNRILVTESLPLWVRGSAPKSFSFNKLINNTSTTLRHQRVTLEYASNPAWYAVQALPYMMEYPYECSEQLFSRYYANTIASGIAQSDPEIKRVFDSWKSNPESLTSNLEKNQELKSLLLQETPWVLQAQNETENKKRLALLFDVNRMEFEQSAALTKLKRQQNADGGWPWFKGDRSSAYITQYIITGFAHLQQLNVVDDADKSSTNSMLKQAFEYCSREMETTYTNLEKYKVDKSTYVPDNIILQYLYTSGYYADYTDALTSGQKTAKDYFMAQAEKYWTKYDLYQKGLIALIMHRAGRSKTAADIVKSLTETSIRSEEMGMYWKNNTAGYYWYQAPIETQALMVEVFSEVANDKNAVDALQIWLLRQKQTTDWKTTRATAEACYAILSRGKNLLSNNELAIITAGGTQVQPEKTELGTGYIKTNWLGADIQNALGNISITPSSENLLSYGAMYWQYFEDMDKVTSAATNLQLNKQLFLKVNSDKGPVLKPITEQTELHIGDLVTVRIELKSDRDLEYVHLKDMRASAFEPLNVLSSYKWQDGLGYYEATGDASTNFFISYLSKGTYVFEYPVRVSQKGQFSNGISTIQCMYAPEFTSHSAGMRVVVK